MRLKNAFIRLFFSLLWFHAIGQELPPIEVFTPQMYNAGNQNWAISQSASKYIYVANNKGLLEYDGASWRLYPTPNETIMRSVASVGDKIYTGCYMEFGFWVKNNLGQLEYASLSDSLSNKMLEDEQIWKIIPLQEYIIFQSLHRIYLYNTKTKSFKIIESENTITKMFLVEDTIMYHKTNEGVFKIENGKGTRVLEHSIVKENAVINVFPFRGGYLIQTNDKGFYVWRNNQLQKWDLPSNNILNQLSVYSSIQLKDKSFLLGTISNGMVHLTENGDINYRINQIDGLANNTVLSLFEDVEENIWLGLDNGLNCVNLKSPLKIFNDQKGSLGTVYTSAVFNGNFYLGTNQGLFYKKQGTDDDFKLVKGTKEQVWNLVVYDQTLFCGHNEGTFIIMEDTAEQIAFVPGTWDIKPISEHVLLQGNYDGLYVLEKINNKWRLKNKLEGFDNSARFFEIGTNNNVFVSHEYKGVFNLKINEDFTKVTKVSQVQELPKDLNSSLVKYDNDYLYAYKEGIFKYNNANDTFSKDSILSSTFSNSDYVTGKLIVDKKSNRLWTFSDKYLSYISPGKLSAIPKISTVPIPSDLRKGKLGFENINNLEDEKYLLGTSDGYLLIDLDKLEDKLYSVTINAIENYRLAKAHVDVPLFISEPMAFENKNNNFKFMFSVPEFDKYAVTEFQYQLEGMYDQWSPWSQKSDVLFENLPYGDYVFNVKARVGNEATDNVASYQFSINRPWYLSSVMILIYALLSIGLILLINYLYKRYYKKQRENLLQKAQRELELKQLENEQQIMRIKNESLRNDIEGKNRELAISTMSLIKKNEFLNSIKKELNDDENNQNVKSVIKIIDKNLNNTDDWKFFEEAFNNADKDFLKKVKNLHHSLTPNDLRLCAYLRLNLSSKEIAPLLNISHRSVEVKRYRLRKKMSLTHETSLTNYILEI